MRYLPLYWIQFQSTLPHCHLTIYAPAPPFLLLSLSQSFYHLSIYEFISTIQSKPEEGGINQCKQLRRGGGKISVEAFRGGNSVHSNMKWVILSVIRIRKALPILMVTPLDATTTKLTRKPYFFSGHPSRCLFSLNKMFWVKHYCCNCMYKLYILLYSSAEYFPQKVGQWSCCWVLKWILNTQKQLHSSTNNRIVISMQFTLRTNQAEDMGCIHTTQCSSVLIEKDFISFIQLSWSRKCKT